MITEKTERRWELVIMGNERGSSPLLLQVNSIDGDPKSAKVRVDRCEAIVPVADLIDLLKRLAAHTSGIPSGLDT